MKYPEFHQQIVTTLLEGKFITQTDDLFFELKKEEEFYVNFFKSSFGFDLHAQQEFYYLISNETNETTSRNFSIFSPFFVLNWINKEKILLMNLMNMNLV
nr:hypothetical protein [Faecalibacter sp. LW9]